MTKALIERLQWEPMSAYRAEVTGDETFIGWSRSTSVLSAIYNVEAAQAKGKKLKKDELYPVPKVKKQKRRQAVPKSVRELDWFSRIGNLRNG